MERRTGFAVAGAVVMILVAGAIAAGANLGLLGSARSSKVGTLKPADAAVATTTVPPQVVTIEVQDPAHSATARVVPAKDGSSPAVEVQTITVRPKTTTASAAPAAEHETETSSGAGADD